MKSLNATDLTSTELSPAFALHLRASLLCTVLVSNGAVRIGFALDNVTADLAFAVQPVLEPRSQVVVPLGKVEVTRCYISFVTSMLHLHGTDSVFNSALSQFEPALKDFINEELPEVACSQLEPLMEKQASAALSSVLVQLAPFLTSNPPLPPEPAARPGVTLVNWGTFPPAQLLRSLVQRRPERVAGIIQRIRPQKIPLDMLGINRSVTIDSAGTKLRSYTEELTVEGFNSFVPGSLAIQGSGSHVWSTASFKELRLGAKLQAQVRSVDPKTLTQERPLLEEFQVQLQLGHVMARAETLAMVSQHTLNTMEVDQFQDFGCLVASANGTFVGPEAPLALRQLQLNVSQPLAEVAPCGSLDPSLAEVATTLLKVILSGYVPSFEKILQSSVSRMHHAMNDVVKQVLQTTPPCGKTEVYFGPEGRVNLSLLLLSSLLALAGFCALFSPQISREDGSEDDDSLALAELPLATHPAVPVGLARSYPFFVVATMVLFFFSDLGLGTVVNIVFRAGDEVVTIGPAFSFSVMTLSRDSIKGGAWLIAVLVIGLSGLWPFVKLGMLLYVWLTPPASLKKSKRGRLLQFLDEYGKYSLVDSWLAILALCAFNLNWSDNETGVNVAPVPMLPFFTFVVASVVSLVLGHVATVFHRRTQRCEREAAVQRTVSQEIREAKEKPGSLFNKLQRQQAWQLLAFAVFNGASVLIASFLTSIRYEVSGIVADLLLTEEETHLAYGLVSLGLFLTEGFEASSGLHTVQAIFFVFTLAIPLALVVCLLTLLLAPLKRRDHLRLLKVCHVLDAWAAFDVFVLAVVVANFEFWLLTQFLIYHDNVASACNWVHENLNAECLAMECHVQAGFILMALGGVSSYLTPKLYFRYCQGILEEDLMTSESEEELLRK